MTDYTGYYGQKHKTHAGYKYNGVEWQEEKPKDWFLIGCVTFLVGFGLVALAVLKAII